MTDALAEMAMDTHMALRGLPCVLRPGETTEASTQCLLSQYQDEAGTALKVTAYRITLKREFKARRGDFIRITDATGDERTFQIAQPMEVTSVRRVYIAEEQGA